MCLLHFVVTKRLPGVAQLPDPLPPNAQRAFAATSEFALTRDGLWLPATPGNNPFMPWMLVRGGENGGSVEVLSRPKVASYLEKLSGGAISRRVAAESREPAWRVGRSPRFALPRRGSGGQVRLTRGRSGRTGRRARESSALSQSSRRQVQVRTFREDISMSMERPVH